MLMSWGALSVGGEQAEVLGVWTLLAVTEEMEVSVGSRRGWGLTMVVGSIFFHSIFDYSLGNIFNDSSPLPHRM